MCSVYIQKMCLIPLYECPEIVVAHLLGNTTELELRSSMVQHLGYVCKYMTKSPCLLYNQDNQRSLQLSAIERMLLKRSYLKRSLEP